MFRRPSLRASVTTLAAAAVLVGGADLASYAAAGNALILGHANQAGTTTSLKNTGRGPALSLNSAKNVPPLVVNSSTLVKNLNASEVGGLTANQINPAFTSYVVGASGHLSNAPHFVTVKPPVGDVQYSMNGIWTSTSSSDALECIVVDRRLLNDPGNFDYVYALFTKTLGDPDANFLNQGGITHFGKHQKLVVGCSTEGDTGPVQIIRPITFSFHKITNHVGHGTPTQLTKHADPRRSLGH